MRLACHLSFPRYIICDDGTVTSTVHRRRRNLKPIKRGKYLGFSLLDAHGVQRGVYWHRLVAEAFHGPGRQGEEVRHLDGIKKHCFAANLMWGTRTQNMHDKIAHGTAPRGENHGGAKLTDIDVGLIRQFWGSGHKQNSIAERFGVSQMTISRIVNNKLWRHVNV